MHPVVQPLWDHDDSVSWPGSETAAGPWLCCLQLPSSQLRNIHPRPAWPRPGSRNWGASYARIAFCSQPGPAMVSVVLVKCLIWRKNESGWRQINLIKSHTVNSTLAWLLNRLKLFIHSLLFSSLFTLTCLTPKTPLCFSLKIFILFIYFMYLFYLFFIFKEFIYLRERMNEREHEWVVEEQKEKQIPC